MKKYSKYLCFFTLPLLALIFAGSARADNSLTNQPPPDSADKLPSEFDEQFVPPEEKATGTTLQDIEDNSQVNFKLRNYYLNRSKPAASDPIAWAQGGSLEYRLGKIGDVFSFNTEYFASFPLWAPDDHDGTLLLEPGGNEINVLGTVNPRFTLWGQTLSLYRQRYDLPFLNSQDNRVIPNTFEGYTIAQQKDASASFQYIAGYLTGFKGRNSSEFVSMSDAAGATAAETGTIVSGARYFFIPDLSLGVINLYTRDAENIAYAESNYKLRWCEGEEDGVVTTFSAQYGDERSAGSDLVLGRTFSTNMWGLQQATSYKSVILKLAYTGTDTGATFASPYGSYAGYNSVIVQDFNRAGEKSVQIALSYDFAKLGVDGLSFSTAYVGGWGAIDQNTKASLADESETDFTIDYRIKEGVLKNLWLRGRGAYIHDDAAGTTQDYRIIVNYDIPLWSPKKSDS